MGCWLGDAEALQELESQEDLKQQAIAWAEAVSNALLDPAHAVSASGFDAIRSARLHMYGAYCHNADC